MRSLWTDLLFLHGYITDSRLARRLVEPLPAGQPAKRTRQPSLGNGPLKWPTRLCLGIGDGKLRTQ